ncbi:hypothetical protein YB2330_006662 [Saitoella coloradoensis]
MKLVKCPQGVRGWKTLAPEYSHALVKYTTTSKDPSKSNELKKDTSQLSPYFAKQRAAQAEAGKSRLAEEKLKRREKEDRKRRKKALKEEERATKKAEHKAAKRAKREEARKTADEHRSESLPTPPATAQPKSSAPASFPYHDISRPSKRKRKSQVSSKPSKRRTAIDVKIQGPPPVSDVIDYSTDYTPVPISNIDYDKLYPRKESHFGLIQERLYTDPWKMFVAVLLLNKTTGRAAFPVMWALFKRWDTPEKMAKANFHELRELVKDLGLGNKRPVTLIRFSQEWLTRPPSEAETMAYKKGYKKQYPHETAIAHLYGMGPYAFDCWRIFCEKSSIESWRLVRPTDKELRKYLRWRWAKEGVDWDPEADELVVKGGAGDWMEHPDSVKPTIADVSREESGDQDRTRHSTPQSTSTSTRTSKRRLSSVLLSPSREIKALCDKRVAADHDLMSSPDRKSFRRNRSVFPRDAERRCGCSERWCICGKYKDEGAERGYDRDSRKPVREII